jgi:hypothetical protein
LMLREMLRLMPRLMLLRLRLLRLMPRCMLGARFRVAEITRLRVW